MENKNILAAMNACGELPHGERRVAERRTLASHPAAPVQPASPTMPTRQQIIEASGDVLLRGGKPGEVEYDVALVAELASRGWISAPPVQQTGDVRDAWEYSFTHSSATGKGDTSVGPCLTYDRSIAYGVGCFNQRKVVIGQALATTLTDEQILQIFNDCQDSISTIGFARAILAASGGAHAVPDGCVVVPKEPTEAMLKAPDTIIQAYGARLIYQQMLAAAPTQDTTKGGA